MAIALLSGILLQAQGIYQLWGMTNEGGVDIGGVIFKTDGAGNHLQVKKQFGSYISYNGSRPQGSLTFHDRMLYGMTQSGGIDGSGVIFEWNLFTNVYTKKLDLGPELGIYPTGSLTLSGNKFYGMTSGLFGGGTIFGWDPLTNIFTKMLSFIGQNGAEPFGNLTEWNGML